jgi:peptidoglycan hydrolase CwlO-like protein
MSTKSFPVIVATLLLATFSAKAAEKADPAMQKMREMVRNSMLQLRDANAKLANAQAAQAEAEEKVQELQGNLNELIKKTSEEKKKDDRTIEELNNKLSQAEHQSTLLSESLAKWKEGYSKLGNYAKATEGKRAELASAIVVLNRQVADQRTKNAEMYRIATEVLDRYAGFSLGTAITAREPFVGITRVKLENLVQEYSLQLSNQTIRSDNTAAKAAKYDKPQNEKIETPAGY